MLAMVWGIWFSLGEWTYTTEEVSDEDDETLACFAFVEGFEGDFLSVFILDHEFADFMERFLRGEFVVFFGCFGFAVLFAGDFRLGWYCHRHV